MVGGHEIAIRVLFGIRGNLERIQPAHHLPEVVHAVAVGVPVDGIGAHGEFLEVGEAVVVGVARGDVVAGHNRRVERLHDVFGRKRIALGDVVQRELLARHLHPFSVINRADGGPIPEVVLVAVGQTVAVGVPKRRVRALLGDPAVRIPDGGLEFAGPFRKFRGVRRLVSRSRLEFRPCHEIGRGTAVALGVPIRDGVRLGLGEVRHGHPLAADVVVQPVVLRAVVQSLMLAADFPIGGEWLAKCRPAVACTRHSALEGLGRQVVAVVIVGEGAERHVATRLGREAGHFIQSLAAVPNRIHGVNIRNLVSVDVAKVV